MQRALPVLLFSAGACISGCTHQMYKGDPLPRSDSAFLFIHERPNTAYTEIDGTAVNFNFDSTVLNFAPGRHRFVVELNSFVMGLYYTGAPYTTKQYVIDIDLKKGYSYALDFLNVNDGVLPTYLCMFGEPHDAPGSKLNITGGYRTFSPTVQRSSCDPGVVVTPPVSSRIAGDAAVTR